jgi:ABC-type lipoprotein export system ATPase subunit
MNIETLVPKLNSSFANCVKVSPDLDIYRCERIYKDVPRSVYFFRAGPDLPDADELSRIHREVVGPSYFSAQDASRWNHYVVFVADDQRRDNQEFRKQRGRIEANKDYARKLVIYDSEFDGFIDHSIAQVDVDGSARTVVGIWAQKLATAGVPQIQAATARAPLIRAIKKGDTPLSSSTPTAVPADGQPKKAPTVHLIERFTVNRFDARSIAGTFEFGRVNLIRGPNGSGKTSLLEAIEHFFCGATYRSNGHAEELDAQALFAGGQKPVPFQGRTNDYYQERDQRWYGRTVNRGNRLWEGFSRFNFLNTDAAVHFTTDDNQQNLTEALSKIALGPEAANTWNRIGEFEQDIVKELGPIDGTLAALKRSIGAATAREKALKTASPQTEASVAGVRQILTELTWPLPATLPNLPDAEWFTQFAVMRDFRSAIADVDGVGSIDKLGQLIAEREEDLRLLQTLQAAAMSERTQSLQLQRSRADQQVLLDHLSRLEQLLESGLAGWIAEESRLQVELTQVSQRIITVADLDVLEEVAREVNCLSKLLDAFEAEADGQLASLRDKEQALERERAAISGQMALLDNILSQIRRFGHEYATQAPHAQECPLCRTRMEMQELLQRVQGAGEQTAQTARLEAISKEISTTQSLTHKLASAKLTIRQVRKQASDSMPLTVAEQILACRKNHQLQQSLNSQLAQARSQLQARKELGFGVAEWAELRQYFEAQPDFKHLLSADANGARAAHATRQQALAALKQQEAQLATASAETSKKLQLLLSSHRAADEAALKNQLQATVRALGAIRTTFDVLPPEVRQRFADNLAVLAELCAKTIRALDELSAQVQSEHARNKELAVLQGQLARELAQQTNVTAERDRLKRVLDVLRDIKENHSLESGLSSFLAVNLASIQRIFSKIHVPHELRLSSLDGVHLERIGHKGQVKLTQISTGQRAALMLSIFLTLNLSLRYGPPQVLIDDPIAHIDDLNSLSFLDYLADIAESGKRQIFFATANDKLANLFQKKMEFLGKDFRTIELAIGRP